MLQILAQNNIYFAINLFLALTLFSAFWLHLDSWKLDKKNYPYLSRSFGFLLLSISFLLTAISPENILMIYLINITKIFGGLMLLTGLISTKILDNPQNE